MIRMVMSAIRTQMRYVVRFFPGSPFRRIRNFLWNLVGFNVDNSANLMPSATLVCGEVSIGKNTFIGDDVLITGGNIFIGNNCDIAPRVIIHGGSHEIGGSSRRAGLDYFGNIEIGNGSWVGTGAIIVDGAKIGAGVIVAAGSVVIKGTYPDNCLIAGVPAKVVKLLGETGDVAHVTYKIKCFELDFQ